MNKFKLLCFAFSAIFLPLTYLDILWAILFALSISTALNLQLIQNKNWSKVVKALAVTFLWPAAVFEISSESSSSQKPEEKHKVA